MAVTIAVLLRAKTSSSSSSSRGDGRRGSRAQFAELHVALGQCSSHSISSGGSNSLCILMVAVMVAVVRQTDARSMEEEEDRSRGDNMKGGGLHHIVRVDTLSFRLFLFLFLFHQVAEDGQTQAVTGAALEEIHVLGNDTLALRRLGVAKVAAVTKGTVAETPEEVAGASLELGRQSRSSEFHGIVGKGAVFSEPTATGLCEGAAHLSLVLGMLLLGIPVRVSLMVMGASCRLVPSSSSIGSILRGDGGRA